MSCDVAGLGRRSVAFLRVAEGEAEGVGIHCKCHLRKWNWKLGVWIWVWCEVRRGLRQPEGLYARGLGKDVCFCCCCFGLLVVLIEDRGVIVLGKTLG